MSTFDSSFGSHLEVATDTEIIAYCSNPPAAILDAILLGSYSNTVIPISGQAVVKYGPGVKIEEFKNLQHAHQSLDPSIVRVPRPHRFFQDGEIGYLVMEYIKGNKMETLDAFQITKIGRAISHFSSFQNCWPGPLRGGISRGLLWSEGNMTEYSLCGSVGRLEHWFNRRLKPDGLGLSFKDCNFVLCHLDIAPRNIIWLHEENEALCIVDWASAGFYPRIFEWCSLDILHGKDGDFQELVKKTMEPLTMWETENWWPIVKAWGNSGRFYFPPTPPPTSHHNLGQLEQATKHPVSP